MNCDPGAGAGTSHMLDAHSSSVQSRTAAASRSNACSKLTPTLSTQIDPMTTLLDARSAPHVTGRSRQGLDGGCRMQSLPGAVDLVGRPSNLPHPWKLFHNNLSRPPAQAAGSPSKADSPARTPIQ